MIPKTMPRTPHLDLMSPEKDSRKQLLNLAMDKVENFNTGSLNGTS